MTRNYSIHYLQRYKLTSAKYKFPNETNKNDPKESQKANNF